MPKQIGLVTQELPNGQTEVLTDRQGACGGCQPTHGCSTCLSSAKIKAQTINPVGARAGDVVEIELATNAIYISALILYGFPLLGLIIGAVAGAALSANESMGAALAGLAGLAAGFGLSVFIGRGDYAREHLTPSITRVITPVIPSQSPPKT